MDRILARSSSWKTGLSVRGGRSVVRSAGPPRSPARFQPHFETLKYHVSVESDQNSSPLTAHPSPLTPLPHTEATVKLRVNDKIHHEVAEGDGPVNALDAALRKALNAVFPNLREMQPCRLQGAGHQQRSRHRRRRPRHHRKPRRARCLGHRRRQRKHHRSQLERPGRCHRIQTLQGPTIGGDSRRR